MNKEEYPIGTIQVMQTEIDKLQALLKAAEEEAKAGKALYMDAQKRCKAQALRGDTLEAEKENDKRH